MLGMLAAALWGGGDFCGSVAVKRAGATVRNALAVIVIGHLLSLVTVALIALLTGSPILHAEPALWGIGGGIISGVSLVAFYLALASGHMGSSAAVSGLLCAAVPAVVSAVSEGNPGWKRIAGFVLAGIAIWLIASTGEHGEDAPKHAMRLSILGGIGFGFYFVTLKYAGTGGVLWPLVAARLGSVTLCGLLLLRLSFVGNNVTRLPLSRNTLAWIVSGTALDTGGNLSFIAATRFGRLDVAAVLASIYPAGTILLAAFVLHEKTTQMQKAGMLLAIFAVVLITLQ